MSRRIALVSGHFAPSNLVGAHRARLWSRYLPEFGWEPIVITGDPREYEEKPDPDLERLVAPGLRVIHARTFSTRPVPFLPVRLVGDIGIRSFWGCYRALADLASRREIDFVLVTIPSNFLAPVGRLIGRRYGLPFGIDYQDPWISPMPGQDKLFTRAWGVDRLARLLEPFAVQGAALITGMATGYLAGMLERNSEVARHAVIATMPMGSAPEDYELVRSLHRAPFLFQPGDGHFHVIYAGALLPAGFVVLDAFFAGLAALRASSPEVAARLRVHFVGTGSSPDDPNGHRVLPSARAAGVEEMVSEHPHRIGYVDALNHQLLCDAVLVLGSTEPHYTPSKVFQAMMSRRPVFALLHAESTAVAMIRESGAGRVLGLTESSLPSPEAVAMELKALMSDAHDLPAVGHANMQTYAARDSARALAEALDLACERVARAGG
jgi:hypothetical protein